MPTKHQIDKLGNSLIYLSQRVSEFNKTKILKILFLLEERSILKYGVPFLGFDFELWQYGPVEKNVYVQLNESLPQLQQFIRKAGFDDFYTSAADFNDDEFSNIDIQLMDEIVAFARHKTASDLVRITHEKGSLWEQCASAYNILDQLKNGDLTTSNFLIDFTKLFKEGDFLKERYEQAVENIAFNKFLKAI